MISSSDAEIRGLLRIHEDLRLRPYRCTEGKLTIGVGRNLDDRGISKDEADYLLTNDLKIVIENLDFYHPWMDKLSKRRQMVFVDMCFNLGIHRFNGFKNTLLAAAQGDFEKAAKEMLDSKWAKQVGQRAITLARMMREG